MTLDYFISVDWGTSNLRISVIDLPSLKVLETLKSNKGIKEVHTDWSKTEGNREVFFIDLLENELKKLNTDMSPSIPILISGMASSSIGLKELPYADLPFKTDGKSLYIDQIRSRIFLISGVQSESDVIRGEEVQLLGLSHLCSVSKRNIFILPGTHSKHIICDKDEVLDFKTFMTGELFEVISQYTILKNSVKFGYLNQSELIAFEKGVKEAKNGATILNSLFKIRTNSLLDKMNTFENYFFLSGLLIGEELNSIKINKETIIHLCACGPLFELYNKAIEVLNLQKSTKIIPEEVVNSSVIRGHYKLLKNLNKS